MPEYRMPSGLGNVALHASEPVVAFTTPVTVEMRPLMGYSVPFFMMNVASGRLARFLALSLWV